MKKSVGKTPELVRRRPAEACGVAGGFTGAIVAIAYGDTRTGIAAIAGFLPVAVTYIVDQGGVRGLWRRLIGAEQCEQA
jgi:hypothetical protein